MKKLVTLVAMMFSLSLFAPVVAKAECEQCKAKMEAMEKDLNLTPEQKAKVDAAKATMKQEMEAAGLKGHDAIRASLTPEQQATFDKNCECPKCKAARDAKAAAPATKKKK